MKLNCFHTSSFRFAVIVFLVVLVSIELIAQESEIKRPDLQTTDSIFFGTTEKKKDDYKFGVEYRIQAGYLQNNQHSKQDSVSQLYLHGVRLGVTFDFLLPYRFSVQTGLLYSIAYGSSVQYWPGMDAEDIYAHDNYISHRMLQHRLVIPARVYYNIKLWKKLNLFFYTGPQVQIGLSENDYLVTHITDKTKEQLQLIGARTEPYERYGSKELFRTNIQMGLGGGLEWDAYRIEAGYDFGLNNIIRNQVIPNQQLSEWGWFVSFSYKFNQ